MSRKIILLSDGTGNSAAKVWRTNVWRTFEALDLSGNDQVAFYDDGVGTSSFKLMAILGGAFGFGLRRNVIALYKFACRNYRDPDDELFGFGFSRGAFTIRIVMGLIDSQGLVKADNEAELHSLASAAYRAYRRDRYPNLKFEAPYQWIRNMFGPHYPPKEVRRNIRIRFVGVWDTVAAYGMPVYEMTAGIHKYLWPIELPNNHLSKSIMRACQALALDEERTTFHPQLWNESTGNVANGDPAALHQGRTSEPGLVCRRAYQCRRRLSRRRAGLYPVRLDDHRGQALRTQVQVGLCQSAAQSRSHDRRSRHLQECDFEAGQGRAALRPAQGPRRLLSLRAAQAGPALLPGIQKAGRRRGRGRTRQDPRERVQAHRQSRACLRAGRPSALLRRRQGARRRDHHARPIWLRDPAARGRARRGAGVRL